MLSSQLCDACHSSGMACCDHHSFCLPFSCMPQVSNGINLGMWLSPVSQSWNGLREFQFFGPDVTVARSLGLTHEVTPVMEPVIKYQENPHADHPLKFDFFTSTISSVDTPSGSCPMEVSIMGQAGSSATAVSFMGSMLNDTSAGSVKKAGNTMTFYQGNNASGREARILRYKEKKAMRNYEKQIRYATRKTYAEIRPRVRGRFVKNPKSGRPMAPPEYNPEKFGSGWFHL